MLPLEMVDACEFDHHVMPLGRALGVRQQIECFFEALAHPKTLRQSELRLTHGNLVG